MSGEQTQSPHTKHTDNNVTCTRGGDEIEATDGPMSMAISCFPDVGAVVAPGCFGNLFIGEDSHGSRDM